MRGHMPWIKYVVIAGIFAVVVCLIVDAADTISHNCKPTGEQRFVNGFDGVEVRDKLVCDGGRIKWPRN